MGRILLGKPTARHPPAGERGLIPLVLPRLCDAPASPGGALTAQPATASPALPSPPWWEKAYRSHTAYEKAEDLGVKFDGRTVKSFPVRQPEGQSEGIHIHPTHKELLNPAGGLLHGLPIRSPDTYLCSASVLSSNAH